MQPHDTTPEQWRPVVGYEGFYEVSNWGNVRGLIDGQRRPRPEPRPLKSHGTHGYPTVWLSRQGYKLRHFYVHRLVAAAFIGPLPEKHEVNHIDGVKAFASCWKDALV